MAEIAINKNRCKGCGLCVRVCPKELLFLHTCNTNERGYHPVEITDKDACIGCCFCAWTCPDLCIVMK